MFRSLLFLSIAAIFIAVQVLAVSHRVQAGGQGDIQKRPIIRSTTRLINVNVVVTDRQGRPVQGLTSDDFKLFDNGRPEKIAFFSTSEVRTTTSDSVPSPPPGEYTNDTHRSGPAGQGATIILFDTLNSAYLSQAYSLEKIRIFLRQLHPEDHVGIYVLNTDGLKIVYRPDQPASALLEAIQRYDQAQRGGAGTKTSPPAETSTGVVELDRFLRGKEDRQPGRCEERIQITIAALQEIARSTLKLTGRKAVIWVTQDPLILPVPWKEGDVFQLAPYHRCPVNFYPDPTLEDWADLPTSSSSPFSRSKEPQVPPSGTAFGDAKDRGLRDNDERGLLIHLFIQSDIALYPVSAEGLQTLRIFGPGGAAAPLGGGSNTGGVAGPPSTEAAIGQLEKDSNVVAHQLMEDMARRTGGRAFYNRNDLETGLRRALDDGKYGYELAYYPDSDRWKGDWRKLQVKVNRPGVTVVARSGYYAFPELKLLPAKASKQLLEEIAASHLEDTEIPITVKLAPPASATASTVEARVFLSAQILFTNNGDGWKSDFEVLLFQLTAENKILDLTTEPVSLELSEEKYSEALKRGINTLARLQPKPGAALLYVIVHDKRTDAVGSVRIPLDQYAGTLR
jgi:VWFA-related protein